MTDTLTAGARVVYRPYGWFATYVGPAEAGAARIRWDDATEVDVSPHTLDVWPHPVVLVPRAEVRRIHTDHGFPSYPQIDGDGVMDLVCVGLTARDLRESAAEGGDRALSREALADDLDELVSRYSVGVAS